MNNLLKGLGILLRGVSILFLLVLVLFDFVIASAPPKPGTHNLTDFAILVHRSGATIFLIAIFYAIYLILRNKKIFSKFLLVLLISHYLFTTFFGFVFLGQKEFTQTDFKNIFTFGIPILLGFVSSKLEHTRELNS